MTSRKRWPGLQWGRAVLILLFVTASNSGWGQTSAPAISPAPLPSAAQEALNKGILAAKVPDYPLAIRYFEEARKLAPQAPVIFMNLGIAESKMPGRELRAIAWFGAYLAATPDAPNAAAVKEQIAVLEVRHQSNVARLIKTVQDTVAQIPESKYSADSKREVMAELLAESGDLASALNLTKSMENEIFRTSRQSSIAGLQARAGDFASALKTADIITRPDYKIKALLAIGEAQLAANDVAGAQRTLALAGKIAELRKGSSPDYELSQIAETQAKAGDIAGAQKTVTSIKGDAASGRPEKSGPQLDIAKAQVKSGDIAGALKTAESIQNAAYKSMAQLAIAESQAQAGDFANALKTAALIQDANDKIQAQKAVADAQIRAGDFAGAEKTAGSSEDDSARDIMRLRINLAKLKAGDIAGAQKGVDLIRDYKDEALNNIASAQIKASDISGARKTADAIQNTSWRSTTLLAIVEAQARMGDIAGARKAADAIPDASQKGRALVAIVKALLEGRAVAEAQRTAAMIESTFYKNVAMSAIAVAQAKGGDPAGARKTFVEAQNAVDLVQTADKSNAQWVIAEAQAAAEEIAEAQKTADQIQDGYQKARALLAVAEAHIRGGNLAGAEKTLTYVQEVVGQIKDVFYRDPVQKSIAAAEAKAGLASSAPAANSKATAEWLEKLEDDDKSHACPLNTGPFLDLPGYLKSLPPSDDPIKVFDGLRETARKIFTAQRLVFERLKQQAIR